MELPFLLIRNSSILSPVLWPRHPPRCEPGLFSGRGGLSVRMEGPWPSSLVCVSNAAAQLPYAKNELPHALQRVLRRASLWEALVCALLLGSLVPVLAGDTWET